MSHTSTTELSLRKDGADEAVANFRGVMNDNMDLIDAAYGQSLENIAAIEGATASAAHEVGTYLVQNGILYKVITAIAIGDTITPGTNIIATDLNTAVTSLNTAASNITSSLAAVEQTTATANHAIGDYFMLGNVLMQATAAIATGEQISVSNATPATLQSQINSIRDSVSWGSRTDIDSTKMSVYFGSGTINSGSMVYFWKSTDGKHLMIAGDVAIQNPTATVNVYGVKLDYDVTGVDNFNGNVCGLVMNHPNATKIESLYVDRTSDNKLIIRNRYYTDAMPNSGSQYIRFLLFRIEVV